MLRVSVVAPAMAVPSRYHWNATGPLSAGLETLAEKERLACKGTDWLAGAGWVRKTGGNGIWMLRYSATVAGAALLCAVVARPIKTVLEKFTDVDANWVQLTPSRLR